MRAARPRASLAPGRSASLIGCARDMRAECEGRRPLLTARDSANTHMRALRGKTFPDAHDQHMRYIPQRRHYDHCGCLHALGRLNVLLRLLLEIQHKVLQHGQIAPESFAFPVPVAAPFYSDEF